MPGVRFCLSRVSMFGCFVVFVLACAGIGAHAQMSAAPTARWAQLSPSASPPARANAAMAYDAATGDIVLFGGINPCGFLADTWTWDGTNWTQRFPANSPPVRNVGNMVYDAATKNVVLFGGIDPHGNPLGDTWIWDGTNWTQRSPVTAPSPRSLSGLVYDAAAGKVLLFGGESSTDFYNDTWTWDGTNWTQLAPATSPSQRAGAAVTYDAATHAVVLFGGNNSLNLLGDTWTWDGTNWTQLAPATSPTARDSASFAYDPAIGNAVLFSGHDAGPLFLNDTWIWNGSNWVDATPAGSPSIRFGSSMVYEESSRSLVLFGGVGSSSTVLNETWQFTTGQLLGTVNVGDTSTSKITFTFSGTGSTNLAAPSVLTMGAPNLDFTDAGTGTCTTNGTSHSYAAGDSCTVDVVFTPKFAGARSGAVVLKDNSSNVIATAYIHGTGNGPQLAFVPGPASVPTVLGGGFSNAQGVAVDGSGNIYVADTYHNAVKTMPAGCSSAACVVTLGGGFGGPTGVAVDGAGNVYVADNDHGTVKKMPEGCTSSSCVTTLGGSFANPYDVAVDGNGNVYTLNYNGSSAVQEIPLGCLSSSCVTTLGGGFSHPEGIAVDGSGNVYVTSYTANVVKVISPGCFSSSCVTSLGGGLNHAYGVAVDGSGNVYVGDTSNNAVKQIPVGCSSSSCVITLGDGSILPVHVAVDDRGNIFVADVAHDAIKKLDAADAPTLTFATTVAGNTSTDSPQTVTLENIGNQPLSFTVPATGNNPSMASAADFNLNSTGITKCPLISSSSSAGALAVGATCDLTVSFTPQLNPPFGGVVSEPLLLTDNNLNAPSPAYATQSVTLKGTAQATAAYFTIANPGPWISDSPVGSITITAHNVDGTVDTAYTGTVLQSSSDPGFINIGCAASVNGVIACTASFKQAGLQSYKVTDQAGVLLPATTQITVLPGALNGLSVSSLPGTTTSGTALNWTVRAIDLYGNTVTGYTGTVHFTSTDATAVLPTSYTFVSGDAGSHTFSLTLKTPGSQTVSVNDAADSITATSNAVTVSAPGYVVTTTADDATGVPANCPIPSTGTACTLRDAIAAANAAGAGNISFATELGSASSPGTITLANGALSVTANATITGLGTTALVIDGDQKGNILQVQTGAVLSVSNLTMQHALGTSVQLGGAIYNAGVLSLTGVLVQSSQPSGYSGGAGIYNDAGTLAITNSTIKGNGSSYFGGSSGYGGGILNHGGNVTLTSSTVSGNAASLNGGNIYTNGGSFVIVNSTITGSTGTLNGGALSVEGGAVTITDSTIALNNAALAPGVRLSGGTVTVTNSIVAANGSNTSVGNCSGCTLVGNNIVDVPPVLSVLGSYGGPTQTMVPLPGSPALCGGLATANATDQRAYARPAASCYDVGAAQTSYAIAFVQQPTNTVVNTSIAPAVTVTTLDHGNGIPGATVNLSFTGTGTLSGTLSRTTDATGKATFSNLAVNAAGTADKLTAVSGNTLSVDSDAFNITAIVPTITFVPNPVSQTYGTAVAAGSLNATATVGSTSVAGTFAYTTTIDGVANQSVTTATILPAGSYTITATFTPSDSSTYTAGTPVTAAYTVNKATPALAFTAIPAHTYGDTAFIVSASSASAGAVTYTVTSGPATISGNTVTITGAGTVILSASQVAAGNYTAATAQTTFTVNAATPTLTFAAISTHTFGDATFAVSATSASTGAVTYTVTSGPATISGNTVTITGAGTVALSASQAATTNYTSATASTSFTVAKQATADGVSASSTTLVPFQSVTLTATVAATSTGSPSGTVTFYDNSNALGSAVALLNGQAQYVTTLAPGLQHVISIAYSGDANFLASSASTTTTITVAPLDFTIQDTSTQSQNIIPGSVASYSFSVTPTYGVYPGTVSFTASGLPTGATATFSPSSIGVNGGAQTVTFTVQTPPLAKLKSPVSHRTGLIAFALLLLPLTGTRRMRRVAQNLSARSRCLMLLLVLLGTTAGLSGCGSGNGYFGHPQESYNITVTATSGSVQHTSTVILQVQ